MKAQVLAFKYDLHKSHGEASLYKKLVVKDIAFLYSSDFIVDEDLSWLSYIFN